MVIEPVEFNKDTLKKLYDKKLSETKAKGVDKINSTIYNQRINEEIELIIRKCNARNYHFSPYLEKLKLKGRNKAPRIISIPTMRDRLLLLWIKEELHRCFPNSVNRSLPNKYIREIKSHISEGSEEFYYLKLDIKRFFDNINRDVLLDKLKQGGLDFNIINLIECAIKNPTVPVNTPKYEKSKFNSDTGVPQGLAISNILAQIYLGEFDKVINDRRYFYLRYVDDIIILNNGPISSYRIKNIKKQLSEINLSLNDNKVSNGLVKDGFTFLSYKIYSDYVTIPDRNIQIHLRRIAGKFTWYKQNYRNPSLRPEWLKDDQRLKDVFIEELNELITGVISSNKNYGWLFYFSEMNDESLLHRMDKIIARFFLSLDSFNKERPMSLKKMSRAYKVIKYGDNKNYVCNYDKLVTIRQRREFLIYRAILNPSINYSDKEINLEFNKFVNRQIKNIEKDIKVIS